MENHEWTVQNLKELIDQRFTDIETSNDRRFATQERAVETAFDAAKEAVLKSEIGVEKRSDAVYVTIAKLQDALALVMPRAESEQRYTTLMEKINEVNNRTNTNEGKGAGLSAGWGYLVAAVGLVSLIITIILNLKK